MNHFCKAWFLMQLSQNFVFAEPCPTFPVPPSSHPSYLSQTFPVVPLLRFLVPWLPDDIFVVDDGFRFRFITFPHSSSPYFRFLSCHVLFFLSSFSGHTGTVVLFVWDDCFSCLVSCDLVILASFYSVMQGMYEQVTVPLPSISLGDGESNPIR